MAKKKSSKTSSRSTNNSAAFVVGSLVGGLVGAAATLWTTPQTGEQLRSKIISAMPKSGIDRPAMDFSTTPTQTTPESAASEGYAPPPETNFHEPDPNRTT